MNSRVAKNWQKFEHFFEMLSQFSTPEEATEENPNPSNIGLEFMFKY